MDFKWIRSNMDLYHIGENCTHIIVISNSGNLDTDFYKYGCDFYGAAEQVIHYLCSEAAEKHDIAKLDLWYFATVYLYRQSLELLLKASIFQTVTDSSKRKNIVDVIRHNLRQSFEQLIALRNLSIDENENGKWLMAYLSDISRLDEESDMFRYPFGSKFKTLFKKQTCISLTATHDNMNKAYKIIKALFDTGKLSEQAYESFSPQLIVEGGCYYQQSVVGYKYSNHSFYPYFSSYHEVGNFLKDIIMEKKTQNLFMPMCYLYRNAVELGLKRLIAEDSSMGSYEALKITQKKKHSIVGLWNSIAQELKKHAKTPDEISALDTAQEYILAFHNFDQRSDRFRYPCSKDLDSYFLAEKKFDIDNVASCFEELCNFLDATDDMLGTIKDCESEAIAEATPYSDY